MVVTAYITTKEGQLSIQDRICSALKDVGSCSLIFDRDKDCICYLLYECSGEYEDFSKRLIFASLDSELVQNKKRALEKAEELRVQQYDKCMHCPSEELTKRKLKNKKQEIEEYCNEFEPGFDGNECWCENMRSWWDDRTYCVEEMKLEWFDNE